jgi:hypothetical protein
MTIPPDLEAQILRYYHVEKWRVGTIARQLHVHHGTVARVLAQAGLPRIGPPACQSASNTRPGTHSERQCGSPLETVSKLQQLASWNDRGRQKWRDTLDKESPIQAGCRKSACPCR